MEIGSGLFWDLAEPLLVRQHVEESTMMGFPCLRASGNFFAMTDHRTGDLIVKLSASRVTELMAEGHGRSFAPAGKVFKEWVVVVGANETMWRRLMDEACEFAAAT